MDYREQLKQKLVTEEEALLRIPDNAYLFTYGYGEPVGILSRLTELKGKRKGITFVDSLNAKPYPFYSDSEMRGVVDSESIFFAHFCREFQKTGAISFIPNHLGKGFKMAMEALDGARVPPPVTEAADAADPLHDVGHGFVVVRLGQLLQAPVDVPDGGDRADDGLVLELQVQMDRLREGGMLRPEGHYGPLAHQDTSFSGPFQGVLADILKKLPL